MLHYIQPAQINTWTLIVDVNMSVGNFSEARATESNVNVEQTSTMIERMNLNFLLFFMNIGFLCTNTNIREL